MRAVIHGGAGLDTITGGSGKDILLGGGGGANTIKGGNGRNVLIGGADADLLTGGNADDVLMGGSTSHDDDGAALDAIMAEWTSVNPFATRVNNIRNGTGLNGLAVLSIATVLDDSAADTLTGGLGSDWFWRFGADVNGDTAEQVN